MVALIVASAWTSHWQTWPSLCGIYDELKKIYNADLYFTDYVLLVLMKKSRDAKHLPSAFSPTAISDRLWPADVLTDNSISFDRGVFPHGCCVSVASASFLSHFLLQKVQIRNLTTGLWNKMSVWGGPHSSASRFHHLRSAFEGTSSVFFVFPVEVHKCANAFCLFNILRMTTVKVKLQVNMGRTCRCSLEVASKVWWLNRAAALTLLKRWSSKTLFI